MISHDDPRLVRLTDSIYVFVGYATSSAIVTSEGVLAVDSPMYPRNSIPWGEFIRSLGPLKYQVVTEHHEDHTIGSFFLKPEIIISSEVTARELGRGGAGNLEQVLQVFRTWGRGVEFDEASLENFVFSRPTLTYSERLDLRFGGKRFVIFRSPAHTRGSSIVHAVDDRVAFVADSLRPQGGTPRWHSGDPWGALQTIALLEMLDVDWYVPGHGGPIPREAIEVNRKSILKFIDDVRQLRNKGWSVERIVSEGNLFVEAPADVGYTYVQESSKDRPGMSDLVGWALHRTIAATVEGLEDRHPSAAPLSSFDSRPYWWEAGASKETR